MLNVAEARENRHIDTHCCGRIALTIFKVSVTFGLGNSAGRQLIVAEIEFSQPRNTARGFFP